MGVSVVGELEHAGTVDPAGQGRQAVVLAGRMRRQQSGRPRKVEPSDRTAEKGVREMTKKQHKMVMKNQ